MAGCGCKDDKNIPVAKLEDGEPVISKEMADKYAAFVEDIKVKPTNNDLEARIRMLESELNLWKQSYEELSEDYLALMDNGDSSDVAEFNTAPYSERKQVVITFIIDAEVKTPELTTCDVFDAFDLNVHDSDKIIAHDIRMGVKSIGDEVFIDD